MRSLFIVVLLTQSFLLFSQQYENLGDVNNMLKLLNEYRLANEKQPLNLNPKLQKAAFLQTIDNLIHDKGGHKNTNPKYTSIDDRLDVVGYESVFGYYFCENAGRIYDYDSTQTVEYTLFEAWKNSKSHNYCLLSKYVDKLGYYLLKDETGNYYAIVLLAE